MLRGLLQSNDCLIIFPVNLCLNFVMKVVEINQVVDFIRKKPLQGEEASGVAEGVMRARENSWCYVPGANEFNCFA